MGLGFVELIILLGLALATLAVVGIGAAVFFGAAAAATVASEEEEQGHEWSAAWQGHEIVVRVEGQRPGLWVDAAQVDAGERMATTVDGHDVSILVQWQGGVPKAGLTIDGAPVQLSRRPFGTAMIAAAPQSDADPEDPRWDAVVELVEQIRSRGGEAAGVASRAREEVRVLFLEIQRAEKAATADERLGGDGASARRVVTQHESRVDKLLESLRELYHGAVAESGEQARSSDEVLAQLEVELASRRAQNTQ